MGFDRKTIRFGALHKEIKSNLPKDLRFGAYIITGGFINSFREHCRHHGLEKVFPCGKNTTAGGPTIRMQDDRATESSCVSS